MSVNFSYKKMCQDKIRHFCSFQAFRHMIEKHSNSQDFNIYQCFYCDGWHVGHTPKVIPTKEEILGESSKV